MVRHIPTHDVAHGVEISPPVVINNTFRISCCAGGVVERDGIPLVLGQGDRHRWITALDQLFIGYFTKSVSTGALRILYIDDEDLAANLAEGFTHYRSKLRIGDQDFGLAVLEDKSQGGSIETDIESVQDGARHGDSVVGFENLRDVGRHHGDGVAFTDAARHKPAGKSSASFSGLSPGASQRSVDDGWLFGINPLYAS